MRQRLLSDDRHLLKAIEIRDEKLFLKRENDDFLQNVLKLNIKQNRIFVELELHLKDEVRSEFIFRDCFYHPSQFSLLMQQLRYIHL